MHGSWPQPMQDRSHGVFDGAITCVGNTELTSAYVVPAWTHVYGPCEAVISIEGAVKLVS